MSETLKRCQNKARRLNLKSKRKRNMVKKAIELSEMLDMDMCIVFKDRDTDKITQYMSGGSRRELYTIERAMADIETWKYKERVIKIYNDDDYNQFKSLKADLQEDDPVHPLPSPAKIAFDLDQDLVATCEISRSKFEAN